jgi:prepilin-type N-terminal cleavage/methylation domain-containing protein
MIPQRGKFSLPDALDKPSALAKDADLDGYTLIELVVVMALISTMFFFAMPRFRDNVLTDQVRKTSRWVITQTRHLKQQSIREKKDYILHVDIDSDKLWISTPDMEAEALEKAQDEAFQLSEEVAIMDVAFPGRGKILSGQVDIYFYAKGYSDKALIHLQQDNDRQVSFLIEPFLPQTKYIEDYSDFDN